MRWVPEPKLCVEVRRTINCQYLSTTHTSSGSFSNSKVTLYVAVTKARIVKALDFHCRQCHNATSSYSSSCGWGAHLPLRSFLSTSVTWSLVIVESTWFLSSASSVEEEILKVLLSLPNGILSWAQQLPFPEAQDSLVEFFIHLRFLSHCYPGPVSCPQGWIRLLPKLDGTPEFCHLPAGFGVFTATGTRDLTTTATSG